MSGHFVLWRLSRDDLANCQAAGAGWTAVAHAQGVANGAHGVFPGWTPGSRDDLNRVRSGNNVPNRDNIPPHRYLTFPGGALAGPLAARLTADKYTWIADLERPSSVGFGMVALCPNAAAAWRGGGPAYRHEALVQQIQNGATSVEVYYLGGKEIS